MRRRLKRNDGAYHDGADPQGRAEHTHLIVRLRCWFELIRVSHDQFRKRRNLVEVNRPISWICQGRTLVA